MTAPLGRRLAAEAVGTGLLVAVVVGSGIQATEQLPAAGRLAGQQVREPLGDVLEVDAVQRSGAPIAAYLAAMPHILDEISNVTGAHAFHVRNLPLLKGQRVTVSRLKT